MKSFLKTTAFVLVSVLALSGCKKKAAPPQAETPLPNTAATPAQGISDENVRQMTQVLTEQLKDEPDNLHYNLGNLNLAAGKFDAAISEYRQALAINSKDPDSHAKIGVAELRLNRQQDALAEFQAATKLSPLHVEANTELGDLYRKLNRPREAVAAY